MSEEKSDREERNAQVRMLRAKNGNFIYPNYPADALALLDDPRLEGMVEGPTGIPNVRALHPEQLTREESKYLRIHRSYNAQPSDYAVWVNKPDLSFLENGRGLGFDHVHERPRIEQPKTAPKKLFHFWEYAGCFVASPDVLELLREICPSAISSIPIEWIFSDGLALDGYELLDVIAIHEAYDYRRSIVNIELRDGRKSPTLGHDRALREDIPASACLFRDSFHRQDVFISRDLAAQLSRLAKRELRFEDVQTHHSVEFASTRAPRKLKAKLKKEHWPTDDASLPLQRRVHISVIPLLRSGRFDSAEALLTDWMRALPTTSFHAITDLAITTPIQRCAEFFNEFCAMARTKHGLKSLYAEMNGFAINPDLWFCDAFGFTFDGGEDGYDWLGDFNSWSTESLTIDGLEPLQQAFANWMTAQSEAPAEREQEITGRRLAEALVIVKFQRWLQNSVAQLTHLNYPFWATAHDYYEYLGKIAPRSE